MRASRAAASRAAPGLGDPRGIAGNLDVIGSGEDDDVVEAITPVGKDACRLAAGAGIALHFEDQGRFNDGDSGGIAGEYLIGPALLRGDDGRMDDGVQIVEPVFFECQLCETGAIQAAIRADYLGPEDANDLVIDGVAGLHHVPAQFISLDHVRSQFAQHGRDCALAAAKTAGEPDAQHGSRVPAASGRRAPYSP